MNLEARNPGDCIVRGPDFGWIIRECGKVVARQGSGVGEQGTNQLHTISGVADKLDYHVLLVHMGNFLYHIEYIFSCQFCVKQQKRERPDVCLFMRQTSSVSALSRYFSSFFNEPIATDTRPSRTRSAESCTSSLARTKKDTLPDVKVQPVLAKYFATTVQAERRAKSCFLLELC